MRRTRTVLSRSTERIMKILVLGSNGQLGRALLKLDGEGGYVVKGYTSSELDITGREQVRKVVKEEAADVVINAAAYTAVDKAEEEEERAFEVNARGAANSAEAANDSSALLIYPSTDFVFDGSKGVPYKENDKVNPLSVYASSKLAGEEEVARIATSYRIVRTSWLYGSGGRNFVNTILKLAAERDSLSVVSDQVGSPTWTVDLAQTLLALATEETSDLAAGNGIYNYSNEGVASWYDFAVALVEEARALGFTLKCKEVVPITTADYPTPAKRPGYSVLSKEKIKAEFALKIPHWRVSLREMLREVKESTDA